MPNTNHAVSLTPANLLWSDSLISVLIGTAPVIVPAYSRLFRVALSKERVLAANADSVGQFGSQSGSGWWLYLAEDAMTGVYEAGFCGHGAKARGHFFVKPEAEASGVIATLDFPTELKLLDLTGDTAVLSGLCELVQSPNRPASQRFAQQMVDAEFFSGVDGFDGILYPSRMSLGKRLIALHFSIADRLLPNIHTDIHPFSESPEYRQLARSPFVLPETAF